MRDVYPVFYKAWYGFGDHEYTWQLSAIYETEAKAKRACDRVNDADPQSRRESNKRARGKFGANRPHERTYQRNMVI